MTDPRTHDSDLIKRAYDDDLAAGEARLLADAILSLEDQLVSATSELATADQVTQDAIGHATVELKERLAAAQQEIDRLHAEREAFTEAACAVAGVQHWSWTAALARIAGALMNLQQDVNDRPSLSRYDVAMAFLLQGDYKQRMLDTLRAFGDEAKFTGPSAAEVSE